MSSHQGAPNHEDGWNLWGKVNIVALSGQCGVESLLRGKLAA